MMLGRWRLDPIPITRQAGLPFRVTDSDWLVVSETESPIAGLGSGIACVSCHPSFCKDQCLKPDEKFPMHYVPLGRRWRTARCQLIFVFVLKHRATVTHIP